MLIPSPDHPPQQRAFVRPLLSLTWPIAVSLLSYSLMTFVDTLFVGRKGAAPIAAVGLGGLASFTLLTFAMGLLRAGKVLIAHAHGAKQFQLIDATARSNVVLALLLTGITAATTLLVAPLLRFAFAEAEPGRLVTSYVFVRAAAIPFFLVGTSIRECSQALGDSRRPMNAALVANLANIPFNAVFVLLLDWGVVGSALANVIAQAIEFSLLANQRRGWMNVRQSSWATVRNTARLGWPLGAEMFLDVSSFATLAFIIARFGAVELAAHQIALQISHLTALPLLALAESASVLAGQSAGARRFEDVSPITRSCVAIGLTYAAGFGTILFFCSDWVASLFTAEREVRVLSSMLVHVVAGFNLSFVLYASGRAVLRGLGDLRYTACVTVGVAWICTPTLGLLLGRYAGWGVMGGWCGIGLEVTLASALYFTRLERRGWAGAVHRMNSTAGTRSRSPLGPSESRAELARVDAA
jgi:MATE family multidrug resistance protein